ncbi:BspA family leucine-rich repeat surface protein [Listeria monocytogenes]|uniref:BspA family leucine-rich repeat surface protein n=1 Tax=Listeria monocytogenes TaxID=1639 RepID=A0A6X4M425_LISMN|nr:BspA family leucine-rich repeat surface protein [Listeria monocytogenes]EAC3817552.1 BspA family leucine-rich repeat surface protein [Listeria monocytogenes]EAC7897863.1 BspA family leucine-rich repeat surface protein [Listeria monocytogenes]EAF8202146.1 BspA family leucine-rich repeat surface protein [Listeria monocytogenes]EAG9262914.1 BspA family leucine-rich repeat surface protein [Listeria monocytogenes]EFN3700268.1 BspA family leucine-rich repeat surface protein [Listeria monocytogene
MNKFSVRIILIISVLFIACGSANVSIAQERDTINKLPEVELGSLYTSNLITEEVAQDKPAEVENLEEAPTTDDSDLTVVDSGAYWTIYRNTANGEYSLHMFGNVPSSKPTAWNSYLNRIKHIEIEEATLTGNFEAYFRNTVFTVLESVRIERSNLSRVTSFALAFYSSGIEKVIIRDNDYPTGPSLLTTEAMFKYCSSLTELDVSGLNTSAVTTMRDMFYSCSALEELDLSHFDTSSVTNMFYMFYDNEKLEKLDVGNFDTSSVTNMYAMFANCTSLEELDVSNFDTNSATDMYRMFDSCVKLKKLDVSNFDTSSVTDMAYMFRNCSTLEKLDVSNFNTSSVTSMRAMFAGCNSLEELDVSNFDTSSVTNMSSMFLTCTSLEELDLSNFDTSLVDLMGYMFKDCANLKTLYLNNFTDAASTIDMFTGTTSLTYLFVSHNFKVFNGLENTNWYDEKNWVQFETVSQLQAYHWRQNEPIGYRKGVFLSLTMDAMGGQFEDAEEQKVQSKISGEYWEEVIPVKEGHYFDGWYLDQDCTNKFDFSLPADASITIYAKWIENYTVIIPASISLNETSELKVEGINRGDKDLSVGLNRTATSISESNELSLANTADTTVRCLAPMSWDGSETNPEKAILTLAPGSEITEGDAVMNIATPENIQAGKYTGNLVFSIKYE